jgi:2-iminobutanoate/2-iminopropanoate deaminase
MTELITAPGAPVAAGPCSPGLLTDDWIFPSGQGGLDPETGGLVSDDIAGQTAQVFRNIEVLPRAAGASLTDVVSCVVHLSDLGQFAEFNASCAKQFPGPVKPARTTAGSSLVAGMRVEVTVVACRPGGTPSAGAPAGR